MTGARRVAVVAGNYRQYVTWCRDNGEPLRGGSVFYATVESLGRVSLGSVSRVEVVRTGTWQERRDLADIEALLAAANRPPDDGAHATTIGHEPLDLLYFGRCTCGAGRWFLTWELTLAWRDTHETEPA